MPENTQKSFITYQASAGAGKTYNLAKEFIRICLLHYPKNVYKNILAITFTNKAVEEMKERILRFLNELANKKNNILLQQLTDIADEDEISRRCGDILSRILHNYSDLSVCTIDSLFQKLAQSFAVDLHIPLDHRLELDSSTILQMVVDNLLAQLGYDNLLTERVLNFSFYKMEEEKSWNIERELKAIGKQLHSEEAIEHLKHLKNIDLQQFTQIIAQIFAQKEQYKNNIQQTAQEACNIIKNNGIEYEDFFRGKKGGIGCWFEKISKENFSNLESNTYVLKAINENFWYSNSCKKKAEIDAISHILEEKYAIIQKNIEPYCLFSAILKNIHSVALLNEMSKIAEDIKQRDKIVHISEATMRIAEFVETEYIPFIYERIGERYKYIFIDEFQDTSTLQWHNLLPFVTEVLSSAIDENNTGKTLIFGDAKQAIYRFRGGNVQQFINLPHITDNQDNSILKEREQKLIENYDNILLDNNFRSKSEIINFNNQFFKQFIPGFAKNIYANCEQKDNPKNTGGGVSLTFYEGNKGQKPTQKDYKNLYKNLYKLEVKSIIEQLLQQNYDYQDITILMRSNNHIRELAEFLLENGIPVISNDSLLLDKNLKIIFLLSCLEYLESSLNPIARYVIIDFVMKQKELPQEQQYELVIKSNADFLQFIQQHYPFYPQKMLFGNLYSQVEHLLQIFQLNEPADPFVLSFLEIISSFMQKNEVQNRSFLDFWEEGKDKFSISSPKGSNAVTIMSIHKSKGLEFPVVIYPCPKDYNNHSVEKWVNLENKVEGINYMYLNINLLKQTSFAHIAEKEKQEKDLDELNANYVAFTRAKERLYCIACKGGELGDNLNSFFKNQPSAKCTENIENQTITYSLGAFENKKSSPFSEINSIPITHFTSTDIRSKIHVDLSQSEEIQLKLRLN
ncbi:MAG: UvrD-helicase domain-containing protein [Bacteroidales bacterium]|jgi:ATP-dependent exoDNAse (exonuclease V) beta subunit|nr:UvrD-helicase domain-containing protein [Bacteroidales bacterium]